MTSRSLIRTANNSLPSHRMVLVCALTWISVISPVTAFAADKTASLSRRWQRLSLAGDRLVSRELFSFADAALRGNSHRREIEQAYAWAEEMQDRDPASPTFGNFRWYKSNPKPLDKNAVEFCMSTATASWIDYQEVLTPTARASLERLMRFGAEGLKRHSVGPDYTNIFLEKTWNMIGVGQSLDMPELRNEGQRMLEQWLIHVWQNGVAEYLSGTYYGVSFGPLEKIAQYADDLETRDNANAGLKFFWTDVAANWFDPCNRLGGACSREYNFQIGINDKLSERLEGARGICQEIYIPPASPGTGWAGADSVQRVLATLPRMVRQRWGSDASQTAAQYVTHRFSIGSAGANYGPMDRPLTVNISSSAGEKQPFITFLMDARDDAYCVKPFRMPNGHSKARHLSPFLTSVQNGPEVLLLASDHPQRWRGGYKYENLVPTCLQSHLTFPSDMEIWIGERKLNQGEETFTELVPSNSPVFLRQGQVTVGVRVVLATTGPNRPAQTYLVRDEGGLRRGVMRLTCIHDDEVPTSRGTVALWVAVTEAADKKREAEFRRRFHVPISVQVTPNSTRIAVPGVVAPLEVVADISRERTISVSGSDAVRSTLLTVNGEDLGSRCLSSSPAIKKFHAETDLLLTRADDGLLPVLEPERSMEAESAILVEGALRLTNDPSASGEAYLAKPVAPALGRDSGRAMWLLDVPGNVKYYFWARLQTPSTQEDSFYVSFSKAKGREVARTAWHTGVHTDWHWVRMPLASPIRLNAGYHFLAIHGREAGAKLDAVTFSSDREWNPNERFSVGESIKQPSQEARQRSR